MQAQTLILGFDYCFLPARYGFPSGSPVSLKHADELVMLNYPQVGECVHAAMQEILRSKGEWKK